MNTLTPFEALQQLRAQAAREGGKYVTLAAIDSLLARVDAPLPCKRPPRGWVCSRPAGHAGPCAADMAIPRQQLAEALNARYGSALTADSIRDFMPRLSEPNEVQVQATRNGHTDWYSIRTDEAGKLLPDTIEQLPF